ncbi:hypothetical protein Efla_002125 [Eimeria flavescens]
MCCIAGIIVEVIALPLKLAAKVGGKAVRVAAKVGGKAVKVAVKVAGNACATVGKAGSRVCGGCAKCGARAVKTGRKGCANAFNSISKSCKKCAKCWIKRCRLRPTRSRGKSCSKCTSKLKCNCSKCANGLTCKRCVAVWGSCYICKAWQSRRTKEKKPRVSKEERGTTDGSASKESKRTKRRRGEGRSDKASRNRGKVRDDAETPEWVEDKLQKRGKEKNKKAFEEKRQRGKASLQQLDGLLSQTDEGGTRDSSTGKSSRGELHKNVLRRRKKNASKTVERERLREPQQEEKERGGLRGARAAESIQIIDSCQKKPADALEFQRAATSAAQTKQAEHVSATGRTYGSEAKGGMANRIEGKKLLDLESGSCKKETHRTQKEMEEGPQSPKLQCVEATETPEKQIARAPNSQQQHGVRNEKPDDRVPPTEKCKDRPNKQRDQKCKSTEVRDEQTADPPHPTEKHKDRPNKQGDQNVKSTEVRDKKTVDLTAPTEKRKDRPSKQRDQHVKSTEVRGNKAENPIALAEKCENTPQKEGDNKVASKGMRDNEPQNRMSSAEKYAERPNKQRAPKLMLAGALLEKRPKLVPSAEGHEGKPDTQRDDKVMSRALPNKEMENSIPAAEEYEDGPNRLRHKQVMSTGMRREKIETPMPSAGQYEDHQRRAREKGSKIKRLFRPATRHVGAGLGIRERNSSPTEDEAQHDEGDKDRESREMGDREEMPTSRKTKPQSIKKWRESKQDKTSGKHTSKGGKRLGKVIPQDDRAAMEARPKIQRPKKPKIAARQLQKEPEDDRTCVATPSTKEAPRSKVKLTPPGNNAMEKSTSSTPPAITAEPPTERTSSRSAALATKKTKGESGSNFGLEEEEDETDSWVLRGIECPVLPESKVYIREMWR